jgi:ribosomal protein S18 acetylase RimI-like enzyme
MHSIIRPAELGDLNACFTIDHSYQTGYVWQMEEREEEGYVTVTFRTVRLPRTMGVDYPRDKDYLLDNWRRGECFLVADQDGEVRGYLDMIVQAWHATGWLNNLVVGKRYRRQGIGGALLKAAIEWAREQGLRQLMLETQTKNYPAICFYQRHGFVFCGFNDHYYTNQDIALFFAQSLR